MSSSSKTHGNYLLVGAALGHPLSLPSRSFRDKIWKVALGRSPREQVRSSLMLISSLYCNHTTKWQQAQNLLSELQGRLSSQTMQRSLKNMPFRSCCRKSVVRGREQSILKKRDNPVSQIVDSIKIRQSKSLNLLGKVSGSLISFSTFFLSQKLRTTESCWFNHQNLDYGEMVGSLVFTSISPCLHLTSPMSKRLGILIIPNYSPKDFSATSTCLST